MEDTQVEQIAQEQMDEGEAAGSALFGSVMAVGGHKDGRLDLKIGIPVPFGSLFARYNPTISYEAGEVHQLGVVDVNVGVSWLSVMAEVQLTDTVSLRTGMNSSFGYKSLNVYVQATSEPGNTREEEDPLYRASNLEALALVEFAPTQWTVNPYGLAEFITNVGEGHEFSTQRFHVGLGVGTMQLGGALYLVEDGEGFSYNAGAFLRGGF